MAAWPMHRLIKVYYVNPVYDDIRSEKYENVAENVRVRVWGSAWNPQRK